jgi:hypothetical protein
MEAILLIAVVVGIYFVYQKLTDKASKTITQQVLLRGSHKRGQKAVHTGLEFSAPNSEADELTTKVRIHLDLPTTPSGVMGKPYLSGTSAHGLAISIGNRFAESAELVFAAEPASGGGCEGFFAVKHWTETEGIVSAIQEIERLQALVREAVSTADDEASFTESRVE